MRIQHYRFGKINIEGKELKSDFILADNDIKEWWRKSGHRVGLSDLIFPDHFQPETVIFGTGYYGMMKVDPEVREFLSSKNIEVLTARSTEAVRIFNSLEDKRKVLLAMHLTC